MKRIVMMLSLAALLVAALTITAAGAFAAAKECSAGDPGCKTETGPKQHSGNSSADFNTQTTETQRGNVDAKGTTNTETITTTCTGPSGKELRADHPQCS